MGDGLLYHHNDCDRRRVRLVHVYALHLRRHGYVYEDRAHDRS